MIDLNEYYTGYLYAGVDEVGRGPLAGPVVTAAVILDPNNPIEGLADSKKLSEKKRIRLAAEIKEKALAWSIARAEVEEIDSLNILHAALVAMRRAVEKLSIVPEYVFVDGNKIPEGMLIPCQAIIKGDSKVDAIAAASIVAKVERDNEMVDMSQAYPQYGFEKHKGYGTQLHLEQISMYGICRIHRKSFAPVKKYL